MGGHVTIGDHAVIGGAAALHQFVRIGRAAMVGGVSGVEGDVIPFGSVIGNRARLAGLNVDRAQAARLPESQIQALRTRVSIVVPPKRACSPQRLAETRARTATDPLVAEVLDVHRSAPSHRGLIRADVAAS